MTSTFCSNADPRASTNARPSQSRYDLFLFFFLACAITWACDLSFVLATLAGVAPPAHALPLVGLGAFGPTLAAVALAARRGTLRDVFGRWRTRPVLVLLALCVSPLLLHLPATLIYVALGKQPTQWFYPPIEPERIAGLVFFSLGEEFGWRGYAYPRVVQRYGPVLGNLLLGAVWGVWHLGMMFTAEQGAPALLSVAHMMLTLALSSVVWAWLLERGNRSMALAIALHVSGHLDNVNRAPESEVMLKLLRLLVLLIVAALAARSLSGRPRPVPAQGQAA